MATYLLTWNPARWPWDYLQRSIAEVKAQGYCFEPWGCGVTEKIVPGDRVFLIKLGDDPRGIVASGWVTSTVYRDLHWNDVAKAKGKTALYVDIHFDTILDPEKDIFPRAWLGNGIYTKMNWEPRASGITIPGDVAAQLEQDWARFLNRPMPFKGVILAEER